MPHNSLRPENPRRRFLAQITAAAASLTALSPFAAGAEAMVSGKPADINDAWMKPLRGKHRQIFHGTAADTNAMLMASNFLTAYQESYAAKNGEVNAVIGLHSSALTTGFNDAMWAKYAFGKSVNVVDPKTKEPALRNIFASDGELAVTELQKRGVVFLLCNTALRLRTKSMAASLGVPYDTLYAELSSSRLPGTILVPALVVALNRAQESGFTYVRAS